MTDTREDNLLRQMPPSEDLAVETIARLVADGYTSSVMKLPRPVLNELGRRLITAGSSTNDAAVEWLKEEGHELPKTNVYRFAQRFREVFKSVWAGWADKLVVSHLATQEGVDVAGLQRLIKNRVHTLIAQEVITTSPHELDTSRLNSVLSLVIAADKGKLDQERLLLDRATAEHRAMKLEADLAKLRADAEAKRLRIEERVKGLESQLDDLSKRTRKGESIPAAVLDRIRDELLGLVPPAPGKEAA